jgi:ABC-type multidrug transport system fused ATPase/permease subunit
MNNNTTLNQHLLQNGHNNNTNDDDEEYVRLTNKPTSTATTTTTTDTTIQPPNFLLTSLLTPNNTDTRKGQGATLTRLWALAYPERYILFIASVALFVSSGSNIVMPALFGKLIQTISVTKSEHDLNETMIYLCIVFIVASLFSLIRGALFTLAGERIVARFRARLFDALIHLDIEFYDTNQSGELQSRLANDTSVIQNAVTVNVSMMVRFTIQAIVSLAIDFYISWKLTLIMFAIVPPIGICARLYGTYFKNLSKSYQDSLARAAETAEEAFQNIRTVRAFSREQYEISRYVDRVNDAFMYGRKRAWAYGIFLGVIGLGAYFAMALVLWYGGRMVIRESGDLSASELTAFLLYTLNLAVSLGGLSELYSTFMSAVGASERLFKLLDMESKIPNRSSSSSTTNKDILTNKFSFQDHTRGQIIFDHVEFSYSTRPDVKVLQNINFTITPGTLNALVGPSGAGKSTILHLILRLYDPVVGSVVIDGVNIRDIPISQLHARMAIVSQEPALFACSIRDNIKYGTKRPFISEEEIHEAARRANALDFILSFPNGFNELVGERGIQLSGGQKQRVAIARALLVNPDILLLDEATSALDSESEHLVQLALDELMKNRTTIVVAHRLSTVRNAQCIFVIDQGIIYESGTHEELMNKSEKGLYAALISRQLKS